MFCYFIIVMKLNVDIVKDCMLKLISVSVKCSKEKGCPRKPGQNTFCDTVVVNGKEFGICREGNVYRDLSVMVYNKMVILQTVCR